MRTYEMLLLAGLATAYCKTAEFPTINAKDCDAACETLDRLNCKTSSGRPYTKLVDGMSCADGCKQKTSEGVDLHVSCVAVSTDCGQVDRCAR